MYAHKHTHMTVRDYIIKVARVGVELQVKFFLPFPPKLNKAIMIF